MTLTLFAEKGSDPLESRGLTPFPARQWQRLFDDQPIVSAAHPLHLYHGYLGAQSFWERRAFCCFDPAFYAGYPKTPVFDSGSRPAELFLTLAGGGFRPAVYKIGLAICCLCVPMFLFVAARGMGLDRAASCVATVLGLFVWWGVPCRQLLEAGDLDLLLGSVALFAQMGMLVCFHRAPGFRVWAGLLAFGCLGCFAQPLLVLAIAPLILVYFLSVGAKHGLTWHLAFLAGLLGGAGINAFWLYDWFRSWWIRAPLTLELPLLSHRTFRTFWDAPIWGDAFDRILASILFLGAVLGVLLLNQTRQRPAARLLGLGAGGFLMLALAGLASEPLASMGTSRLLVLALWFAAVPAAHALVRAFGWIQRLTGGSSWRAAVAACCTGVVALLILLSGNLGALANHSIATTPLAIGLSSEQQALIATIVQHTTCEARILWEDPVGQEQKSEWTALLPVLTNRAYLGGLDSRGSIEHAYPGFADQNLAGRPIASWSDAELREFCRHYNAGWVVCRSVVAIKRFREWCDAVPITTLGDEQAGFLFQLQPRTYVLKGQARFLHADCRHIALADVVPDKDGKVVLSMHYQSGFRASPGRVLIEREPDPLDPIPLIRLRLRGPVARLTLTWEER